MRSFKELELSRIEQPLVEAKRQIPLARVGK
jgi:hypothetical protein